MRVLLKSAGCGGPLAGDFCDHFKSSMMHPVFKDLFQQHFKANRFNLSFDLTTGSRQGDSAVKKRVPRVKQKVNPCLTVSTLPLQCEKAEYAIR